ncbi:coiled-coil domain-containing protein 96 [Salvelinus namaycush]|uniref:Coiled-coil domain-containing protein 96 n=1 Tax=Salvelinus namaycush TaxID=8040 RepID=A0A8U0QZZ4_SALNM|nr:coiled-coil domain-containing protein 96 [Salvelinus namaycush]
MDGNAEQKENDPGSNPSTENTELKNDEQLQHTPAEEPSEEGKSTNADYSKNKADTAADEAEEVVAVEQSGQESEKASPDTAGEQATEDISAGTEGGNPAASEPVEGAGDESPTGANLPTSETFEEGEGPEMKPLIGEPLSREGSLTLEDVYNNNDDEDGPPKLDPGTPERESSVQVEEKGPSLTKETGPSIDYKEYMNFLYELQAEKDKLSQVNGQLQIKLVEYFRKKTGDDARPEKEKAVSDQEQRYQKYMAIMEDLKWQHRLDSEAAQQQAEELRQQSQEKLGLLETEWSAFMALKRDVAVTALSRRLGKQAAAVEVEQIQAAEQRRQKELVTVRLENIKLKNKTRRFEATLRAKEMLAEGLHLIDFEQLKIENQTYNEKIEERNEELLKLRKKITSTVQVLTHVKEKLQFVQMENQAKRAQLAEVEVVVARKRDVLTRTKQARDGLRMDNLKLRQRCGLLGNETLLRDFEEKVDASDDLEERLEGLKRRHAELILKCAGVKKKLEHTKP